jgi:hypothetical protein
MDEDLLNQPNQKLIKSGDLVVDLSSFENGFEKEKKKYRQEIWDYVQYRESLVRWPPANEKIKMGTNLNHGSFLFDREHGRSQSLNEVNKSRKTTLGF